jgi:uncharacterized protein (TIGR03435 family)
VKHLGTEVLLPIVGLAAAILCSAASFDVASIKPNQSGERTMLYQPGRGGRFTATNCSLNLLIQYAYDVVRYQISGAPEWVVSDRFDVSAKAERDTEIREIPAMLQRLLEDRFQLKYHWDTKEAAGYSLVVSKAGKLREAHPGDCSVPNSSATTFPDAPCGALRNSPGHTQGNKLTAGELAGSLSFFVQAFVLDTTNLAGRYDIDLQWAPESVRMQSPAPPEAGPLSPVESTGPSIFTALQEQLGLRLEPARGPVKILVIEHVQRPSEN